MPNSKQEIFRFLFIYYLFKNIVNFVHYNKVWVKETIFYIEIKFYNLKNHNQLKLNY